MLILVNKVMQHILTQAQKFVIVVISRATKNVGS